MWNQRFYHFDDISFILIIICDHVVCGEYWFEDFNILSVGFLQYIIVFRCTRHRQMVHTFGNVNQIANSIKSQMYYLLQKANSKENGKLWMSYLLKISNAIVKMYYLMKTANSFFTNYLLKITISSVWNYSQKISSSIELQTYYLLKKINSIVINVPST